MRPGLVMSGAPLLPHLPKKEVKALFSFHCQTETLGSFNPDTCSPLCFDFLLRLNLKVLCELILYLLLELWLSSD